MNNEQRKKIILKLLEKEGKLPRTQIGDKAKIHYSVLQFLLKELEEEGKIESEVNFSGSYKYYKLKGEKLCQ